MATPQLQSKQSMKDSERRQTVYSVAILLGVYAALRLLAPHLAFRSVFGSTIAATVVFMTLSLVLVLKAAELRTTLTEELVAFLILSGCFGLCSVLQTGIGSDVALMLAAFAFGKIISRLIRHPNLVLPVAVVAAVVDIWGVNLGGPVSEIASHAPKLVEKFTAKIPSFGGGVAGAPQFISIIGVGDFAFLAMFFACLLRFGMNTRASAWLAGIAVCVGMLLVTLSPKALALPGLPFMALGILLPNLKHFQFTRAEKFAMLYAGLSLVLVLTGVLYGVRALLTTHGVR